MINIAKMPWGSKTFKLGVMMLVFAGVGSILQVVNKAPTITELTGYSGVLSDIRYWVTKNTNGVDLFLSIDGEIKRFNGTLCYKPVASLTLSEKIYVYVEEVSVGRISGRIWQIETDRGVVCSYEDVSEVRALKDDRGYLLTIGLYISGFFLIAFQRYFRSK